MKKLIVLSDNHSETGILYDVYQQHEDADAFFHLGDSEFKYDDTELSLFLRVKGNMDFILNFLTIKSHRLVVIVYFSRMDISMVLTVHVNNLHKPQLHMKQSLPCMVTHMSQNMNKFMVYM